MMNAVETDTKVNRVVELLDDSRTIAVIPSKVAGPEAFAAAAGLYTMLVEAGKDVSLVYTGKVPEQVEDLLTKEEITSNIFTRDLIVSIDYSNTPAAKVHYATDNDVLTLKLGPVSKDFSAARVKTYVKGMQYDLIFTIGVQELYDLGQTYKELESEFRNAKIVNIDNTDRNTRYGYVNVIDASVDALSNMVLRNCPLWGLFPSQKAAKSLLKGITLKEIKNGN